MQANRRSANLRSQRDHYCLQVPKSLPKTDRPVAILENRRNSAPGCSQKPLTKYQSNFRIWKVKEIEQAKKQISTFKLLSRHLVLLACVGKVNIWVNGNARNLSLPWMQHGWLAVFYRAFAIVWKWKTVLKLRSSTKIGGVAVRSRSVRTSKSKKFKVKWNEFKINCRGRLLASVGSALFLASEKFDFLACAFLIFGFGRTSEDRSGLRRPKCSANFDVQERLPSVWPSIRLPIVQDGPAHGNLRALWRVRRIIMKFRETIKKDENNCATWSTWSVRFKVLICVDRAQGRGSSAAIQRLLSLLLFLVYYPVVR